MTDRISDMYETALRNQLRFNSQKGELTLENLWRAPLTSHNEFNLNSIAKGINSRLKAVSEENFVGVSVDPERDELELKLNIVKHVINVKLDEVAKSKRQAEARAERAKLLSLLEKKQEEKGEQMTEEEIKQRLSELE